MDRTIELIKRAKEGDHAARNQVASENLGFSLERCPSVCRTGT